MVLKKNVYIDKIDNDFIKNVYYFEKTFTDVGYV
jgi:hypothetical protein